MRHVGVALAVFLIAVSLSAATFELPTGAQLRDRADVVVVATVLDSASREADGAIVTDSRLRVEQLLKGTAAEYVTVTEAGGFANGRGMIIAGSATYEPGTRVLAFLRNRGDGSYYTSTMALGKYRFEGDLLVRDAHGIETMTGDPRETRDAAAFLDELRSGRFTTAPRVRTEAVPTTNANPPASYVFNGGSPAKPIRWENCDSACFMVYDYKGTQPGGASMTAAVDAAMSAWTDDPNSFVFMTRGGASSKIFTPSSSDGENTIFFNHMGITPAFCDAGLACGVVWATTTQHTFRSTTWYTAFEGDVVVLPNSWSQTALNTIVAHEVGHTLSFIDTSVPNALMNGVLNLSRGAVLGPWDQEALTQVYGPGVACTPVTINSVSGGGSVPSGGTATLSVNASGDGPLQYQWYEGASGVTTTPVGTNSPNFTTPPITTTKQYWVKVANACPSSANSSTVTVTPTVCNPPEITNDPSSQNIAPGGSVTLHVAANGTLPFTYQWFRANAVGDTSQPVGTNSPNFTTGPLNATTSYWVRVTNNCDSDDSALATITVGNQCVPPSIVNQPSTLNLTLGDGATIAITATGTAPLTYQWFEGNSGDTTKPIAGATTNSYAAGPFNTAGTFRYWVRVSNSCNPPASSQTITINVACPAIVPPQISAPAVAPASTSYTVSWTGAPAVTPTFELQEATNAAFTANLQTFTVSGLSRLIPAHTSITTETRFYYRVRAISACTGQPSAYSPTTSTIVTPPLPPTSNNFAISIPAGTTQTVKQDLLVPGFGETATPGDTFSISIDAPWLTVFPQNGALSAGGTTVQLTINPASLGVGSRNATITIARTQGTAGGRVSTNAGTTTGYIPFSVSMVTPVSPDPRDGNPPAGTLIIPAVANAQGIGSPFRSDVRIVNVSFDDIEYDISYTPSGTDGTQSAMKTTVTIGSGEVMSFDDIVKAWYGAALSGESALGTIEIRPLNGANPLATFASSRTFAITESGTLGQFVPALRIEQFVGNIANDPLARISLQQVANSANYRTNLGFVEGTGTPATLIARLLNGSNEVLSQFSRDIPAFGHFQNNLTALFGNVDLADGRVEVEVTSPGGKVSAYASVLNNPTNDPLLVFPVQPARNTASRYVLAGIAEFDAGARNFHSDMRIYNSDSVPVTVTLEYYDRGQSTPLSTAPARQITLNAGEVRAINDVLPTLWPGLVGGGSVVATAPDGSRLVLTAQTYSRQPDGGTKGQFIPGVTFREATGVGERAVEVLQLEQSPLYRSNVGFVEVTGKSADIEIILFKPDEKVTAVTSYNLKPNEYIQFDRILEPLGTVYNGRVSVRVIGGQGRVYCYGSIIDNRTEDPTYVPGQ
jgi:Ig-like domain CHU_C associated